MAALDKWLALSNREAELKKKLKDAEADLDAKAYAEYPKLTEAEVKTLVVDDKWLAALAAAIHGEMDRISQALTQRVKELAERYETPLPDGRTGGRVEQRVNVQIREDGICGEWRAWSVTTQWRMTRRQFVRHCRTNETTWVGIRQTDFVVRSEL